jgi:7-cyano-7-deazaguanine synthase
MLPDVNNVVIILSGGMDSTIAMRLCVERYGSDNVKALTFNYGQKQKIEIEKAKESTALLSVEHKIIDASFLNDISTGFSANVDPDIKMPTIKEVLGDPTPLTYVPNRNMILLSIAAAYAETKNINTVICGLQVHDEYSYWDTTQSFVDKINTVLNENRKIKINIVAPFSLLSKKDEIKLLYEVDGNIDLLKHTITCYNPNEKGESCGKCPSCSERIKNLADCGYEDLIPYSINIPWDKIIRG